MSHSAGNEPDPSRTEAAEAGAFHEEAETAAGVGPREHVTADALAPDHLAQDANLDVEAPPDDATKLLKILVAVVAVIVVLGIIAVAVAITGS